MQVKSVPPKPTLLYDNDCGFCLKAVEGWQKATGDNIVYESYQQALGRFPKIREEDCRQGVQLILPDGHVISSAHAVLKIFDLAGNSHWPHWAYEHLPLFGRLAEALYSWVSHHRMSLSRLLYADVKKCG